MGNKNGPLIKKKMDMKWGGGSTGKNVHAFGKRKIAAKISKPVGNTSGHRKTCKAVKLKRGTWI